jgi:hypothetical protein
MKGGGQAEEITEQQEELIFTRVVAVAGINQVRANLLLRTLGKRYKKEDPVPPGEALLLWLAGIIQRELSLTSEQQELLLLEITPSVIDFGKQLSEQLKIEQEEESAFVLVSRLTLIDRTWACISGLDTFIDLRTGEKTRSLRRAPVMTVSLDLAAIYRMALGQLRKKG